MGVTFGAGKACFTSAICVDDIDLYDSDSALTVRVERDPLPVGANGWQPKIAVCLVSEYDIIRPIEIN